MSILHTAILLGALSGGDYDCNQNDSIQIDNNSSIEFQIFSFDNINNDWLLANESNHNALQADVEQLFHSPLSWNDDILDVAANVNDNEGWLFANNPNVQPNYLGNGNIKNLAEISVDQDRVNRANCDLNENPNPANNFSNESDSWNQHFGNDSIGFIAVEGEFNFANQDIAAPLKRGNALRINPVEENLGANSVRNELLETENSVVK